MSTRNYQYHLPVATSLSAPSVRMLVLSACYDERDGTVAFDVDPVVALEDVIVHQYHARASDRPPFATTHAEMTRAGWVFEGAEVEHHALVAIPDYGLCRAAEAFGAVNVAHEVVAALWPEAEDGDRLFEARGRVGNAVLEAARRRAARSGRELAGTAQ